MNYVIRVGHPGGQSGATRVGVAVNMVNFGPSLAAGAGPTGIKEVLFLLAACSRTQSGRKNL